MIVVAQDALPSYGSASEETLRHLREAARAAWTLWRSEKDADRLAERVLELIGHEGKRAVLTGAEKLPVAERTVTKNLAEVRFISL